MQEPDRQVVQRHLVDQLLRSGDHVARRADGREVRSSNLVQPQASGRKIEQPDGQGSEQYQGQAGGRHCEAWAKLAGCHVAKPESIRSWAPDLLMDHLPGIQAPLEDVHCLTPIGCKEKSMSTLGFDPEGTT